MLHIFLLIRAENAQKLTDSICACSFLSCPSECRESECGYAHYTVNNCAWFRWKQGHFKSHLTYLKWRTLIRPLCILDPITTPIFLPLHSNSHLQNGRNQSCLAQLGSISTGWQVAETMEWQGMGWCVPPSTHQPLLSGKTTHMASNSQHPYWLHPHICSHARCENADHTEE